MLETGMVLNKRHTTMKNTKSHTASIVLALLLSLFLTSCEKGIYGKGDLLYYAPETTSFDAITLNITANVNITYAESNKLSLWAQENIMNNLEIFVSNRMLYIKFDERVNRLKPIEINILTPKMSSLKVNGACEVKLTSSFTTEHLDIHSNGNNHFYFLDSIFCDNMNYNVFGTSALDMKYINADDIFEMTIAGSSNSKINELHCNKIGINVSGSANSMLCGTCQVQKINNSGILNYAGLNFVSQHCDVTIYGEANLDLNVENELFLNIIGNAKVQYKGNPKVHKHSKKPFTLIDLD